MNENLTKLAKNLVSYSIDLKEGEKVLIEANGVETYELVRCLVKEVYKKKGLPFVKLRDQKILRETLQDCRKEQLEISSKNDKMLMQQMDAYVGIRGGDNISELSDVDSTNMKNYTKNYLTPVLNERVNNTKWVILRYPNGSMAQLANMSSEAFEDFYFKVCNQDYSKMSKAMDSLVELMEKTNKVEIKGNGTNLTFSVKDIPVIKCDGKFNIPDGEVFTAPVKNSVNGTISYNAPTIYEGITYENIKLEFKDGKIIKATANDTERINKVFDTDEGARFVGEFAIGVHPYITKPMKDILFDEKIMGSFHFTPGKCYDDAPNGNNSSIHWDLVCIQTPEFGGGEIYFDDVLIRKDGMFVIEKLMGLNPENLTRGED